VGRKGVLGEPPFLAVKLIHLPDEPAGVAIIGTQTVQRVVRQPWFDG
jgi:hypothetical protein